MAKIPASSLTVFTLDGTSVVGQFSQATLTVDVENEDGAAINDVWSSAVAAGKSWQLSCQGKLDTTAFAVGKAVSDPVVTVVFTTGAGDYSGTALVSQATHGVTRRTLQDQSITLLGQGQLTVA